MDYYVAFCFVKVLEFVFVDRFTEIIKERSLVSYSAILRVITSSVSAVGVGVISA